MKRIKSTTKLTFFTTLLITSLFILLYMMVVMDINADLLHKGINYSYFGASPTLVILLIITSALSYFVSSLIIDRIFNPIRLMITKVNEIGNMNFSKPLAISSENDEFTEYANAFNKMSENLKSHIERQKRFISDASHELVTPITVINGHADLLLRRWREQPEILDNELVIIKSEALRMNELVEGLLLLARSDSKKQVYKFERIELNKLILESVSDAKIIFPDFEFKTTLQDNVEIMCDELSVRQVLRIILSNAVKYSGSSRQIIISTSKTHSLVNITVTDFGIGIKEEHLPFIFDRFYRVDDSRSKKTGSSGLGLAIAKEIVTAHGGELNVVSEPGSGSKFTVILSS